VGVVGLACFVIENRLCGPLAVVIFYLQLLKSRGLDPRESHSEGIIVDITEVRISLLPHADDQLMAFCTITFDKAFVVRDIRVINGPNGPFVAMPSRRVTINCSHCHYKNFLGAKYCSECGRRLPPPSARPSDRSRGYVDIAHPINAKAREMIQGRILEAYQEEVQRSKEPGYESQQDMA
jgi:stage V sporulation protein G